ncbi:MAG: DUF1700 domain-containing protein [Clostridia bacterium]|nr:DUF1700 domain-containing protein [Clostridia bacterium]
MNRKQFLMTLHEQLEGLPGDIKADAMTKYDDLFKLGASQGKTEEEVSFSLGDPVILARQIRQQATYAAPASPIRRTNVFRSFFMFFVMFFFNMIFFVGPFFACLGVLIGMWGAAFGMSIGGVGVLGAAFYTIISPALYHTLVTGFSFTTIMSGAVLMSTAGILLGMGCWYTSKWFYKLVVSYTRWNFRVIIGR